MINEIKIKIWDREFTLPIEYDCAENEEVTIAQTEALNTFVSHAEWAEKARKVVEDYCKDALYEDEENQKKDNIFSYAKPKYLFIRHDEKNPRIALMCNYRYDVEHGLAVIFSADGGISVGMQDDIL